MFSDGGANPTSMKSSWVESSAEKSVFSDSEVTASLVTALGRSKAQPRRACSRTCSARRSRGRGADESKAQPRRACSRTHLRDHERVHRRSRKLSREERVLGRLISGSSRPISAVSKAQPRRACSRTTRLSCCWGDPWAGRKLSREERVLGHADASPARASGACRKLSREERVLGRRRLAALGVRSMSKAQPRRACSRTKCLCSLHVRSIDVESSAEKSVFSDG